MFCPIAVSQTRQVRQYRPQHIVDLGPAFLANLFVVPRYNHYYYGSYYGYQGNAIVPWVTYGRQTQYYDPLFASYAYYGSRVNTLRQIIQLQRYISTNQSIQPTRTLVSQARLINDVSQDLRPFVLRAATIDRVAQAPQNLGFDVALQSVSQASVQQLTSVISDWRQAATVRADLEQPQGDDDRQRAEIRVDESGNGSIRTNSIRPRTAQFRRPQMTNMFGVNADRGNRVDGEAGLQDRGQGRGQDRAQDRAQDRGQDALNPNADANTADANNIQPGDDPANAGRTPTPPRPDRMPNEGNNADNTNPDRPQDPADRANPNSAADDTPANSGRQPRRPGADRPSDSNDPLAPKDPLEDRFSPEVANDANIPDALNQNRNRGQGNQDAGGAPPRPNRGRQDAQRMTPDELQRRYEEIRQSRERGGNARPFGDLDSPSGNPNDPQGNAAQPPNINELRQEMQRRSQQNQRRNPDAASGRNGLDSPAAGNPGNGNRRRPGQPTPADSLTPRWNSTYDTRQSRWRPRSRKR